MASWVCECPWPLLKHFLVEEHGIWWVCIAALRYGCRTGLWIVVRKGRGWLAKGIEAVAVTAEHFIHF